MLDASPTPPAGGERPPVKRSLFNRPAWAKADVSPVTQSDSGVDSFSRSSYAFEQITREAAEKVKRRQERLVKRDAKAQQNSRPKDDDQRGTKRRRVSVEADEGESEDSGAEIEDGISRTKSSETG
jgi:hypothetical protein